MIIPAMFLNVIKSFFFKELLEETMFISQSDGGKIEAQNSEPFLERYHIIVLLIIP